MITVIYRPPVAYKKGIREMNITKASIDQYVEMCKQADEIQAAFRRSPGDYYYAFCAYTDEEEINFLRHEKCERFIGVKDWSYFWLPRQDQLQEMVLPGDARYSGWFLYGLSEFKSIGNKLGWPTEEYYLRFESMEQLWLAFVMKEKYDKVWNGKEWRIEVSS